VTTLTIRQAAVYAADWFPDPEVAATMAAIAMAESAGDTNARGDKAEGDLATYAPNACDGYLSFGLWQVFLGVHRARLYAISGLSMPCEQASWLMDPNNNARVAAAILADASYNAWSAYKAGTHKRFLVDARLAIAALPLKQKPLPMPSESPIPNPADAPDLATYRRWAATLREMADYLERPE